MENFSPSSFGSTVQLDQLGRELSAIGIAVSGNELCLDPLAGNPNRHDFLTCKRFRVLNGGNVLCLLIVGKALEPSWKRSVGFAAACPAIACRPLCFFRSDDVDHLAIEYFEGRDLERMVQEQHITAHEALRHAASIVTALEQTLQPSTFDAAAREIDAFFTQVCALPLFTGFDQIFFARIIFPFVRAGALANSPRTRWTNGDLIPRNILVDQQKNVRLIDYEFASCTHFFAEDAWRWRTFADLPAEARELPIQFKSTKNEPWFEAFCLLRQLVLAHAINGAHMAVIDSQPALLRLREIATAANDSFRTSVFLRPLGVLPELEKSVYALEKNKRTSETTLHHQNRENARLAQLLHQREARLARMQATLAWRAMSLLRALRATLTFSKPPRFHFHLDTPRTWRPFGTTLDVRGWCFAKTLLQLNDVRIQIERRTYEGVYGIERVDVRLAHPEHPQAYRCGFQVEIEIQPGDQKLEVSICDEHDRWHIVHRADLNKDPDTIKGSYAHWIKEFDTLTPEKLGAYRTETLTLPNQPLISIILPVYNTPETYLAKAIDSVRAQTYERWELCIADDASSAPHVRTFLNRYAEQDKRIKIAFRATNGHIAAASNTASALATGEYVALLDHDDELRPHALAEAVKAINQHPDLQLIYSDEDKLDSAGNRFDPYFKPDWMPELLIGHNYLCHFCVCRADALRAIGGWRSGFDGAQDWDLQFRITEQAKPSQIVHIPRVLYHWRAAAGSTALATSEKDYVIEAARRAITEHFKRINQKAELIHQPGNHWRARYALPALPPRVSLIIPTRNGLIFLRRCLESILEKTSYPNFEVIIADNGSDDATTCDYLQSLSKPGSVRASNGRTIDVRVLPCPGPFNYAAINNTAVGEAHGEFVALLNNDLEVITPDWLEELVSHAARPGIGCVGPMLYYPNDTLQHAGVVLGIAGHAGHAFKGLERGTPGYKNHARLVKNYSAVTGACLIVRKSIYQQVGGLDETELAVSLNDVDFCLKVRAAGYRNLWTPFAELYHHESATRGYEDTPEKKERFARERETLRKRWLPLLLKDPGYNPNLTADSEDFALAFPPRHDTRS